MNLGEMKYFINELLLFLSYFLSFTTSIYYLVVVSLHHTLLYYTVKDMENFAVHFSPKSNDLFAFSL